MAFGQELKDFVASFQAGYNLVDSKEEREEKRAERKRKQESHEWGREDTLNNRAHRDNRAAESDRRYQLEYDWRGKTSAEEQERWLRGQEVIEREWLQGQEDRKILKREGTGGAIPDEVEEFEPRGVQPISYRAGDEPRSGTAVARALVNDLSRDFGMPREIAAGVVGQLAAESGGFTTLQEIDPTVPGSRGGFGYAQWTGPRRRQFERFAKDQGLDPRSYAANYNFLKHELQNTSEGRILRDLRKARDPLEAGRIFTGSAAERKGFLRPGKVNQKGRDQWTKRVYSLLEQDTRPALGIAAGGMVTALPEEEDEDSLYQVPLPDDVAMGDEGGVQVAQAALPEDAPIPAPRYEGTETGGSRANDKPTDDPYETARIAVREGLNRAAAKAKADVQGAIDDPEMQKYQDRFIRGYGAAPQQVVRQMMDKIDPERKMSPSQRNILAFANTYRFFHERGEPEKAKEAAASLAQYFNQSYQQLSALSRAALEKGDLDGAARAAIAAYANIPNGRDMKITKSEGGKYEVTVTDDETGEVINKKVLSPEEMAATAAGFGPQTFYDELYNAADIPADKFTDASLDDIGELAAGVDEMLETQFAESGMTKGQLNDIRSIVVDMSSVKENQLDPGSALQIASEAMAGGEVKIGSVRGNSGMSRVIIGDNSFVMKTASAKKLKGISDAVRAKPEADRLKAEENNQWYSDQLGTYRRFLGALGGAVKGGVDAAEEAIGGIFNGSGGAIPDDEPEAPAMSGEAVPSDAPASEPASDVSSKRQQRIEQILAARDKIMRERPREQWERFGISEMNRMLKQLGYEEPAQ